jgi:hypothetical protein
MVQGSWQAAVVADLRTYKQQGHRFEWAWARAVRLNPPARRDKERVDPWGDLTLLNQNVLEDPSVYEFFKRECEAAWHGDKPRLAQFSLGMLVADAREVVDTGLNAWAA